MPKKILMIDDDQDMLESYKIILEGAGYAVVTANNGKDGMAAAEKENPDLVILDIMMEEVDSGLKVAEILGRKKPILMLSSIAGAADRVFDTTSLPIRDLAEKPLDPQELMQKVERLLLKT